MSTNKHPKQYNRTSNSFSETEVKIMKTFCDCALRQVPVPLAVVRNPSFKDVVRKIDGMKAALLKNALVKEVGSESPDAQGDDSSQEQPN